MQKYQEFFDVIKEIIKKINDYGQPIKYDDNYMKIRFNTDDNIPLNKIIKLLKFPYNNHNNKIYHKKR